MASAGPNRLTAKNVPAKVFAIQAVLKNMFQTWTMRLSEFTRCFISTIVVAVGEMGRSSSFCKRHYVYDCEWDDFRTRYPLQCLFLGNPYSYTTYAELGHTTTSSSCIIVTV